jgi:aminopeptidase N
MMHRSLFSVARATVFVAALLTTPLVAGDAQQDLRDAYDVSAYDLELAVRPEAKVLEGVATISGEVLVDGLQQIRLDLNDLHEVRGVSDASGSELEFERIEHGLVIALPAPLTKGSEFRVSVSYRGEPKGGGFDGFHWEQSESGKPWINTACQGLGAHYWWPCKASFFNADDKPERVSMAITCPADLYAVSNGRLLETRDGAPSWFDQGAQQWKTYAWRHDYPLETYAVTLNVAEYVVVEQELEVPGLEEKVPFIYYVLPENAEKAALQFQEVPELVRIYSEAFGPFPFPDSKFALVETNFWGMEHSTAVAYGSSYPAWCKANGEKDRYEGRNRWFDYILIHEVAHEWWGNAVSAEHWGHFWIHEGFGTYAEGVYVEMTQGREAADKFFANTNKRVSTKRGRLYRGEDKTSGEAYTGLIYSKGSAVLNTLRHYVDNDEAWWKSLADFNLKYRYGNATTEDFQAVLERNTSKEWGQFFQQWVYGQGAPKLVIELEPMERGIIIEVDNTHGEFRVPLDLAWSEKGEVHRERLWIEPGESTHSVKCSSPPTGVHVEHLDRLLGKHEVK